MEADAPQYGLWSIAFLNAAIFIIFAFSFAKPRTECQSACKAGSASCVEAPVSAIGFRTA
jgi:hypothetical protein